MSTLLVIPARDASPRYPGKALVPLKGAKGEAKPLIQRTWEAAKAVSGVDNVVVATDDTRIRDVAEGFGAQVVMTSEACENGTERCAETLDAIGTRYDIVVNLQGDAPLTPHWFVEDLVSALDTHPTAEVATPVLQCDGRALSRILEDRRASHVGATTVVFGAENRALYFSKEVIPYAPDIVLAVADTPVFHHVGVYAYRPSALAAYPRWAAGPLERLEGLEQLRFLERERPVLCVEVDSRDQQFWELKNPEDVPRIEAILAEMGVQ
ncbi:MAG: 3-deoxy-manno-octulosonate cytidylyltransferase family protein [Maritimibacter sp.]